MDQPFGSSSSTPSRSSLHRQPSRMSSAQSVHDHLTPVDHAAREALRRGHSDGDILGRRPNERRTSTDCNSGQRETWMGFLRDSSGGRQDAVNQAQLATSRAAMMAADRRNRLTERHEDHLRRRSSSNLSFTHSPGGRLRQNSTLAEGERSLAGQLSPSDTNTSPTPRITDLALPRTPNMRPSHEWRSRDITLPRWQRDAEVSKCPICGTAFSFWYRKHHCRKCGRVVCGNCSPHRITIPRQFIVHPPEETTISPLTARTTGIEVVDLTEEQESDDESPDSNQRPQSSDYRIDPSLGGGQEVRLCNPCVPDPNPLPHLPFSSPNLSSRASFERPLQGHPHHHSSSIANSGDPEHEGPTVLTRQTPLNHTSTRKDSLSRFDGSTQSWETLVPPDAGTSNNRAHRHVTRPIHPSISPPGYSSLYGSAPDQSARQVSLTMNVSLVTLTNRSVNLQLCFKIE